ncbi:MAG: cysteine--tRNA ligase [Candidatus Latescibacterota bacterium]
MEIRFHNTLTRQTEPFCPESPPRVTLYTCGPTVYDFATIGNFRTFLFADLLRRFLEAAGYRVDQVMNLTDVGHMTQDELADGGGEDKMEASARRLKEAKKAGSPQTAAIEDPGDPYQIARYYADAFLADARALDLRVAAEYPQRMPFASQHVPAMQHLVHRLLERGHAYVAADGVVYFSVESFPEYGRLSGNTVEELRAGSGGRVTARELAAKRHPADFLLWKPDPGHIMKWDSPWGVGYPGWHLECSAMAMGLLGSETIDIHTGGEDNIFPHHECEIAQSRAATGRPYFARLWMHARFLQVEGQKMSKSKGNFHTARDVMEGKVTGRPVHPRVLRYELMKTHYRSHTNFTVKGLMDSANAVRRLGEFGQRLAARAGGRPAGVDPSHPVLAEFMGALADDLNISAALAVVHGWTSSSPPDAAEALAVLQRVNQVLDVIAVDGAGPAGGDPAAADRCRQIDAARARRNWATADALRQELIEAGYEVRTTPEGTTAQRRLA